MFGADPSLVARASARIGSVLRGKYRLDQVLGIGGMATVYRATHRNGSEFAVKLLHPELSMRSEVRTRFLREGHAASTVKHTGAVQVLDDDVAEDGSAFLVMELLRGESVEAFWERQGHRLSEQLVVGLGLQLLDVLAAAHGHGVIHRDIKPANLFLTEYGQVKVLDFGIARVRDFTSGEATQAGMMMGTPAFMAPEQAMGKTSEIDAQTDLWAACACLYTLVSGRLVHEGESVQEIMVRAATQRASSLADVLPDVPPVIAQVIDRGLSFEKAGRWATAAAMRDALRSAARTAFGTAPSASTVADLLEQMRDKTIVQDFEPPMSSREGLRMQAVRAASSSVTAVVDSESVFPNVTPAPVFPGSPTPAPVFPAAPPPPPPPTQRSLPGPAAAPIVTGIAAARTVMAPRAAKGARSSASLLVAFVASFLAVAIGGGIAVFMMRERLPALQGGAPSATGAAAGEGVPGRGDGGAEGGAGGW